MISAAFAASAAALIAAFVAASAAGQTPPPDAKKREQPKREPAKREPAKKAAPSPAGREEPAPAPFDSAAKTASLQGLDKVSTRISSIDAAIGATVRFGTLDVTVKRCQKSRPDERPERAAFVVIVETDRAAGARRTVFEGWMFASSPGLNGLEHPTYDVWVKDCK